MPSPVPASKKDAASIASRPNIATLLERLDEPLRGRNTPATGPAKPGVATSGERVAAPQDGAKGKTQLPARASAAAPTAKSNANKRSGLPRNALISAVVMAALIPLAILFVQLWQDMMRPGGGKVIPIKPAATAAAPQAAQDSALEVALTSPAQIHASAGDAVEFPIVIDATAALPERSIVAVTALPDGASFSQGQPDGDHGWRLRPDEIAGLRLKLPQENAAGAMHLQLVAGDGTVLARSDTALNVAALPPTVATVDDPGLSPADFAASAPVMQTAALESTPAEAIPGTAVEEIAQAQSTLSEATAPAETTESVADAPPPPAPKPSTAASDESQPKVNTVKTVAVAPPREAKPYDGAMALGSPADVPQGTGEWMVTKTAVDMHAKAEQSSETVKVAQGGVKMRVVARDNRWIQVHDPATSTTGWIYDRFLTPAEPPAQ